MTRRDVLVGALAAGLLVRSRSGSAKASQPATPVRFDVPDGACDCHTHIHGDPARFPFFAGRTYTPEMALPEEMAALHAALHVQRVVIVTPSTYGTDNSVTLYGMRARGSNARGIVVIDLAIGQIYSPNSPLAQIARIKFRDGSCRTVLARELASGRLFAQICYDASTRAFRRAKDGGERGLTRADMEDAVAAAISRVAHNLTIHNVRNQLSGLPTDLDVVSVECLLKRVTRPHRYLRAG